jgi:hypothetical protein
MNTEHLYSRWRPAIAWSYMVVCLFDFMVGPIIYNTLQYLEVGTNISMWQSITLQGGGLYHLSMGAIVGVSAFGRTKEKLAMTEVK